MGDAVILSACRTAIGSFMGALAPLPAPRLGAAVVREAVRRARLEPSEVEEVILGNVLGAGVGQNPARQAALAAGLPVTVAAVTVNKVCGSGLKAVMMAAQSVRLGDTSIEVAGGMESMTNAPYLLPELRGGARMGDARAVDSMIRDGLWCAIEDCHMGATAERVARKYGIARRAQDEYAAESHRRAVDAIRGGGFEAEIVPVAVGQPQGKEALFSVDERPRTDTSVEELARLRPAFEEDGTVTAANASGVNDGAAALVIASAERARALGRKPMARIVASAMSGVEPGLVMMSPVPAFRKLLEVTGWRVADIDRVELNEAFAVQSIALIRELDLDPERVNCRGGAVALGHPIGASGARILVTLLYALRDSGLRRGVASLCMGGGNGLAVAVELL
ncbi:MAG: acetyl-CoA C-acyltransferase [Acidobacteria bacterium]|nr:MAG: acetyl-CoA C-acyltransferase [Acidobacteriota bacterium]